jgi:hypothetical protein
MNTFLPDDLQLKEAFAYIISAEGFKDHIKQISTLIYDNKLDKQSLEKILKEHEIIYVEEIKEDILDMLVAYINFILSDNVITERESVNLKQLKRFFRIKEGDFYNYRAEEIENILNKQFQRVYGDNKINTEEALYKVGLQELFDLSYDQFLNLIDKEVKVALQRGANVNELDTVIKEIYRTKESPEKE